MSTLAAHQNHLGLLFKNPNARASAPRQSNLIDAGKNQEQIVLGHRFCFLTFYSEKQSEKNTISPPIYPLSCLSKTPGQSCGSTSSTDSSCTWITLTSSTHDWDVRRWFPCADKVETCRSSQDFHSTDKQTVAQRGERTCKNPTKGPFLL